jgi:ABC-type nitrate/sulfonate/bicarbonate transport system permease component
LQRLLWGLLAGIGSGLLLGTWLGASRRAQTLVLPTFVALAQIPTLAWIPLFMLFFGIGEVLKLVVLVKAVVVPVTLHTLVGVRDAQPKLREAAATLRLPAHLLFLRLLLPAALPAFLAGVRLALATGWTSLLAVELLASSEGIGYLMVWGRQLFMLDLVFLCILLIGLVGALMDRGFSRLERSLLYWPQPATGEQPRGAVAKGWQSLLLPQRCWPVAGRQQLWLGRRQHPCLTPGCPAQPVCRAAGWIAERSLAPEPATHPGRVAAGGGAGLPWGCCWACRAQRAPARPEPVGAAPGGAVCLGAAAHRLVRPGRRRQAGVRRPGRVLPAADRHPARHRQPVAAAGRGRPGAAPGPGSACACWCCRAPRRRSSPACACR